MKTHQEYFWVIGGGLLQIPLIAEVRKLGLSVIASDMNPDCPCSKLADVFFPVDIFDIAGHVRCADEFVAGGNKIAAVLAAGIDAPETMAALARHLGLPTVEPGIAHVVNHKDEFRKVLQNLGFPVPRFRAVDESNLPNLEKILDAIRYPLIVKNTDSSGSRGTKMFHVPDMAGIRETLHCAMAVSRSKRALIEECWDGSEATVETIFDVNGRFHPCFITDRIFDKSEGYAMETGLRQPSALPEATQREMFNLAEQVARAIGIKIGAAKYDMILTNQGPRIIEMTVRLSGGFDCQYLVPAATGKNVLRAAILTALGRPFPDDLLRDTKHRVGLTESLWPKPGKILSIRGIEQAKGVPGFEHLFFRYKAGDTIEPYTDCTKRVCFIIVTGETHAAAQESLAKIKNLLRIEVL